jgi:mRNA-degrading endonuclease RelE of RelBE toxin-antitoxin system
MSYNITTLPFFDKQLKRLTKKFPSLKKEYSELINTLIENPKTGSPIGDHCYKIRIAISSKGKGKSGGARIITYIQVVNETVYLVSIYDKSDQDNIADIELKELIKTIPL